MTTGVPVGSIVENIYFAVPDHYTIGEKFETNAAACEYAKARWARIQATTPIRINAPVIDERWVMKRPDGAIVDLIVQRTPLGEAARPEPAAPRTLPVLEAP